jgi:hypothetical protein
MIDWVMPPQTAVALYIYRVGRRLMALKRKESFYSSKFARTPQFYPDSGSTGQTGVGVARSAVRRLIGHIVEGHDLTGGVSLIGLVLILGANICPPVFL